MKQRVCIAIGMLLRPQLIIADEPTSALDVVTQRQVMATFGQLQRETGSCLILIGHDMGLMAQFVDQLAVMYARPHCRMRHRRGDVPCPASSLYAASG